MDKNFEILDLNEENIKSLYDIVLATKSTKITSHFQLYSNNDQHSLFFDSEKLYSNSSTISYIIGQLNNVHLGKQTFNFKELIIKHNNEIWTKDTSTLIKFIYLGIATHSLSRIDSTTKSVSLGRAITPTLSPNDPDFEQWYKEHKSEWED